MPNDRSFSLTKVVNYYSLTTHLLLNNYAYANAFLLINLLINQEWLLFNDS